MREQRGNSGIGILGLIFVVFMTLKIVGIEPVASWSWWWVTAPLWGGFALALLVIAAVVALKAWNER